MLGADEQMFRFAFLVKNFIWFFNSDVQCSLRVDFGTDAIVRSSENYFIVSPMSK